MKLIRERLELKIIGFVIVILVIGSLTVGATISWLVRDSLYSIAEENLDTTATIVTTSVSRAMLEIVERKAEIARAIADDMKTIKGVEEIKILNLQGGEAFKKDSLPTEASMMKRIIEKGASISYRSEKSLVFGKPLENAPSCRGCHGEEKAILGAVKVAISLERVYGRAVNFVFWGTVVSILGLSVFGFIFWKMLRRLVITPVHSIEKAAESLAQGDLSFNVDIKTEDEIGRLSEAIRSSLYSLGGILQRIKDGSKRVSKVAEEVGKDSKKVLEGTQLESESIANIASSIEEMNATIAEISDGTESLAASAEETAASMEEMVTSIGQVTNNVQELSAAVDSTSASIEELSATIKEVANNAGELSAASEETLTAIEEISSSVKEVEQSAKESARVSEKVKNDASTFGMTSIEKTIEGMQTIKSSVEKTADFMNKLAKRSEEIGKILNVIDEITDQTTLLALNAAILAAQAGEHGKGFSVVADEIKDLAERTSFSTQEIAALIHAVQQEVRDAAQAMDEGLKSVEEGFKVAKEAGDALKKIVESAKRSSEMAFSIERSTGEQSKATRLVSEAMDRVKNMVAQIAKATSEQSKGVHLIIEATEKMRSVAGHVKNATGEQLINTRQISEAIELVSDKSQQIARAISDQRSGSNQIWRSVEKIKDIPRQNRDLAFRVNHMLMELLKDSELTVSEMERFKLFDRAEDIIRFGIVPLESPAEMFKRFGPLAEYLGKKLGRKVELKVAVDFHGAMEDIGYGATQLCFMTPSTYLEAHNKYDIEVLVKALRGGKPYHHSVIIVRGDSGINSLEDIKGRTFAFGDLHSTSSHIVPRAMLLNAGIDLNDLLYYNYLGHHDNVVNAVLRGDFDAGGVMESVAQRFKDRGIKIIKFSEDIPEFNICVSRTLPEKDRTSIKMALIALTDATSEGSTILKSIQKDYTGFMEASDEDYNSVRLLMSKLGMI